ncbi:hypothetical protein [Brucella tritici]|uniref:hypothetical protein n=1 Tax=Brucella tritici TaxID=94626 RepID=UPI0015907B48|nr:hypothetical protein [Brucella tritici]
MIDRSTARDTPFISMAFYKVAYVFGTHVAETILASVHVRAQQQAGRMDASDAVKSSKSILRAGGRPRMDEKTGFTVEVATPFKLGQPRSERNYEQIIGVESLLKTPPHVGKRSHLCEIGFEASAARDAKRSQAELNASNAIRIRTNAMVKIQNMLQGRVEKTETFEQDGATGVEFIVAPGIGPNHAGVRQYIAMVDRPAGRITVTCATYATAMLKALNAFRQIRDGARLEAKKQ